VNEAKLRFEHGMAVLPHPDKRNGGEDAAFICPASGMVGVADGVGGWAERGIDAGLYARNLLVNAKKISETFHKSLRSPSLSNARSPSPSNATPSSKSDPGPNSQHVPKLDSNSDRALNSEQWTPSVSSVLRVLIGAHQVTKDLGSSTVCLASFHGSHMRSVNLGDSGFAVLRNRTMFFKSPAQQHSFNFPYQLGSGKDNDSPALADLYELELKAGDIVVLGTDGLFDNVFENDMITVLDEGRKKGMPPQEAARNLALFAQELGSSSVIRSPFSIAAARDGYLFVGGKLDDTSVIVTYVSESKPEENTEEGGGGKGVDVPLKTAQEKRTILRDRNNSSAGSSGRVGLRRSRL